MMVRENHHHCLITTRRVLIYQGRMRKSPDRRVPRSTKGKLNDWGGGATRNKLQTDYAPAEPYGGSVGDIVSQLGAGNLPSA